MAKFRHGFGPRTGDNQPRGQTVQSGKFGRLFPELDPFIPSEESLTELGKAMVDPEPNTSDGDNETIPAGYTYFGQFVDHDITFDTTTLQESIVDPLAIRNFRSPLLDLDSLYGSGPDAQPYLYEFVLGTDPQEKFLLGTTQAVNTGTPPLPPLPNDLPRAQSGLGLLGDPRNDENLIVAQLHVAFLKFHNKVVDGIKDGTIVQQSPIGKTPFEEARDLVTWHYQWIVLHDFLRRVLDTEQLDLVLNEGRRFYKFDRDPFIPVEFSVAAYRLGHSMVRSVYDYNRIFGIDTNSPGHITAATLELLFEFTKKSGDGNAPVPIPIPIPSNWIIDWRRFFELDPNVRVNFSRKLDPFLVVPLQTLPNVPQPNALAIRNLLRGRSLGLPSGQSVAKFIGFEPLTPDEISQGSDGEVAKAQGFDLESPLWYYILKEALIQGEGKHLGQVGSRIVAEVFVGLLQSRDSNSFLVHEPNWKPTLPATVPGTFTLADLLNFVGDLNPIGDGIRSV
ncbi:MAG: peroxidase [Stigonema ocellatum SAG 48.90 = DSM 106950]|nr:peroxidase [Stigonema ocellatum SAG 48.90 = DSM 106950]